MKLKYLYLIPILFSLVSCGELFEKNLKDSVVILSSPADNAQTTLLNLRFDWEELEDVDGYRFQIAYPNFSQPIQIIEDTLTSLNYFNHSFSSPGEYQWRVRGENTGSQTLYSTRSIFIDSSYDLSNTLVELNTPSDLTISKQENINFSWKEYYNMDYYTLSIRGRDNSYYWDSTFANTSTNYLWSAEEGEFNWDVIGTNNSTNTNSLPHTPEFSLLIDQTPPAIPSHQLPANNSTLTNDTANFSWKDVSDNGSSIEYTFILASDTNLTGIIKDTVLTTNSLQLKLSSSSKYFWNIRAEDRAGNTTNSDQISSFRTN